jgi:hypothetical protein
MLQFLSSFALSLSVPEFSRRITRLRHTLIAGCNAELVPHFSGSDLRLHFTSLPVLDSIGSCPASNSTSLSRRKGARVAPTLTQLTFPLTLHSRHTSQQLCCSPSSAPLRGHSIFPVTTPRLSRACDPPRNPSGQIRNPLLFRGHTSLVRTPRAIYPENPINKHHGFDHS